jgi:hypothetical protein
LSFACIAALASASAGCSSSVFDKSSGSSGGGFFSKPFSVFESRDDGSKATAGTQVSLGPSGPVPAEELVAADGRCAPSAAAAQASPVAASGESPAEPVIDGGGQVLGGIALGMSECDAVRRAGLASNVLITADEAGQRKVVLTYLGGTWPGIYTFNDGRLREISRAPEQPKPAKAAKPAPKKKAAAPKPPARTAPPTTIR